MRLDQYLVQNKLYESRNKAQYEIKNENVLVNKKVCTKASFDVTINDFVEVIKENELKYVSKGGLKLERALTYYEVDPTNLTCLDIGASTGGFTDCLIKYGAKKVYSVENGKEQLHESLKNNPKVISYENTNILELDFNKIDKIDLVVIDVSFIKLETILDKVLSDLKDVIILALIKPQFEVGKMYIKNGVIKDSKLHQEVINNIKFYLDNKKAIYSDVIESPILGGSGNKEFLIKIKTA